MSLKKLTLRLRRNTKGNLYICLTWIKKNFCMARCQRDAQYLSRKYELPCESMLSRLIEGLYRDQNLRPEHTVRSGYDLDEQTARQFAAKLKSIVRQVYELGNISEHFHRGVNFSVSTPDSDDRRDVCAALKSLNNNRARVVGIPLDFASAFLPNITGNISRYILFVTDRGPVFTSEDGDPTAQRGLLIDALTLFGWAYSAEQVDEHCLAMQRKMAHMKASQCGLRRSASERAEAIAWRRQQSN